MADTPNTLRIGWYDLLTGNYLGTVPVTQLSFGDTLNGAGPFSCTVNMADAQVRNAFPLGLDNPRRHGRGRRPQWQSARMLAGRQP